VMSQIVNRITSQNHHFMSIKVLTKSWVFFIHQRICVYIQKCAFFFIHFRPKLYEEVETEIFTTERVKTIYIQFFSRSVLLASKTASVINRIAHVVFIPKFSFAPDCHIVAFYVRKDGEIISAINRIEFTTELPNHVSGRH
jgi:hypothetical protein